MYLVYVYENRIIEPIEIALRMGEEGIQENDGGVDLIKACCKHIC
jgi:hypothetical protein